MVPKTLTTDTGNQGSDVLVSFGASPEIPTVSFVCAPFSPIVLVGLSAELRNEFLDTFEDLEGIFDIKFIFRTGHVIKLETIASQNDNGINFEPEFLLRPVTQTEAPSIRKLDQIIENALENALENETDVYLSISQGGETWITPYKKMTGANSMWVDANLRRSKSNNTKNISTKC